MTDVLKHQSQRLDGDAGPRAADSGRRRSRHGRIIRGVRAFHITALVEEEVALVVRFIRADQLFQAHA